MSVEGKYNFRILHTIAYELFDIKYESKCTYEIEIVKHCNSRMELKRHNFKVNDKEITSKFERIAHTYNDALFPIFFEIKEGRFFLVNYSQISDRLNLVDEELKFKYQGSGFAHIRADFFETAAKDGNAMVKYLYSLGLIRIIELCLYKPENNNDFGFHWKVIPIASDVFSNGKKCFDPELNILKYEGKNHDKGELFEKIKVFGNEYKQPEKVADEESLITTSIKHETQYITTELDFSTSETEIKISNSFFNYVENLILTRKY